MRKSKICSLLLAVFVITALVLPAVSFAQLGSFSKEDLIRFTAEWEGERFPDGRPKVPDSILERMKNVEIEEAWGVLRGAGYRYQFEAGWQNLHPERVLVGRAVTGAFLPQRPDVHNAIRDIGKEQGRTQAGGQNSWVIDILEKDDVIVIDLFDKIFEGTYAGGNLANSIWSKTGTGMVVAGGVRDLGQINRLPDFSVFIRGADPTGIGGVTLISINAPTRIGRTTVMPGDVVLGTIEGVIFIPAHLAENVVDRAEVVNMRDTFGFERLHDGTYTPGEIDSRWSEVIEEDFSQWLKANRTKLNVPVESVDKLIKSREEEKKDD
ncbi:RraA family protein [Candidatus Latescibacterota bacterium]